MIRQRAPQIIMAGEPIHQIGWDATIALAVSATKARHLGVAIALNMMAIRCDLIRDLEVDGEVTP